MNEIDLSTEALLARRAKAEKAMPGAFNTEKDFYVREQCAALEHSCANPPRVVIADIDEILRLRAEVERLEKEADWLAHNVTKGCPPLPPERLPDCDNEEHPHDCGACWREATRKAVEIKP